MAFMVVMSMMMMVVMRTTDAEDRNRITRSLCSAILLRSCRCTGRFSSSSRRAFIGWSSGSSDHGSLMV